jgi:hypothetical protein
VLRRGKSEEQDEFSEHEPSIRTVLDDELPMMTAFLGGVERNNDKVQQ